MTVETDNVLSARIAIMKKTITVKPKPYEDEVTICDWCGLEGGEFYTPYDLHGEEYPYEKGLDLHDQCRNEFVRVYGPRVWAVLDQILEEIKSKQS